ncbi:hypothetical protein [Aliidiomarina indica]|uniref:hypothetical protein n=1 Tax=Aliidiomarina indica TaxID=2749147 RepID=UPI00188E0056|nr:hypothetical protein [Aliidiomarina indica]
MNKYQLILLFSLGFSFESPIVSATSELPEQASPCEASMFARDCDALQLSAFRSAFNSGGLLFYLNEQLKPQYASIDPNSISLIFEMGQRRVLFINWHFWNDDRALPAIEPEHIADLLSMTNCNSSRALAIQCILLGSGEHTVITDERYSDAIYIESDSKLHGQVTRIFMFEDDGYLDILISPSVECGTVMLSNSVDHTELLEEGIQFQHKEASHILNLFMSGEEVNAELVKAAGFDLLK